MTEQTTPTLPELITFITRHVVNRFQEDGTATDGATLAEAIRSEFPGFTFMDVGLQRLAEVIAHAEREGQLSRNRSVKHLEVLPGPATGISTPVQPTPSCESAVQFLRPEVWRAFVFVTESERHYLDRESGRIRSIRVHDNHAIQVHDSDKRYVPISRIPEAEQQQWMKDFVEQHPALDSKTAPIQSDFWWLRFSEWLRDKDASLERAWKRERTRRVIEYVTNWAKQNDVAMATLIQPTATRRTDAISQAAAQSNRDDVRRAILAAVGEMPIEELENISIPIRYILRHFRSR
jgi:hypothetical protein